MQVWALVQYVAIGKTNCVTDEFGVELVAAYESIKSDSNADFIDSNPGKYISAQDFSYWQFASCHTPLLGVFA